MSVVMDCDQHELVSNHSIPGPLLLLLSKLNYNLLRIMLKFSAIYCTRCMVNGSFEGCV